MRYLVSFIVLSMTLLIVSGSSWLPRLILNMTDSLPRGLYRKTYEPLARGVIVAECLPLDLITFGKERGYLQDGGCPGNAMPILKKVVAIAGDTVELAQEYVAVNGELIFNSATREKDSKGRWIPAWPRGTFVLKPDEIFLLALNSERSWDGRYQGPARADWVIATLRPFLTEAGNGL